jgi:hypothetical protein
LVNVTRDLQDEQSRSADLEAKIYDLSCSKEGLDLCLLKIKDRFEELSCRMDGMRDIVEKVERENEALVSERAKLVNRAAVSFEQLTPRPGYSSFFKLSKEANLKPTKEIFSALFNELPLPTRQ